MVTDRPTLTEDDGCYYLSVHYNDRDRAKSIGQYRWDPANRHWIYPKDPRILFALIAEFGEELDTTSLKGTPGLSNAEAGAECPQAAGVGPQSRAPTPATAQEIAELKAQLVALQRDLDNARREAAGAQSEASLLKETISALPSASELRQLAPSLQELAALRAQVEILQRERDSARAEVVEARLMAEATMKGTMAASSGASECNEHIKKVALDAAEGDKTFARLLDQVEIVELPVTLARGLEDEFGRILRIREPAALVDMIPEMHDAGFLSPDGVDLAHLVRKQRNIAAHAERPRNQRHARSVATLMAAALLWPEVVQARKKAGV
jgi:hypothetical protein